jgi:tetratricopeptide (TPR) repeat protein
LFISHSSNNDDWAIAVRDWLVREGWSGEHDVFLDLDPERGIAAGQRWARELQDAATRCEAVLFLVSEAWLASKWCVDEYQLANNLNKKLFALLIDEIPLDRLPGGLVAQWQVVQLKGAPAERFVTTHPRTQKQSPVHIAESGLRSLKRGLEKAGIGAETFELQPDPNGPFGWRTPYRGLEAFEPEDAAVFFGRTADIVRGTDMLRGLATRNPPRLIVILGASGAGKSSFLRAGLWPRLARDDAQWLPLRPIRAGRGGAIEGGEGLLAALEEVHRRFGRPMNRASLRERLSAPERFLEQLNALRQAAARRALLAEPPFPLPVMCFDQAEELFAADAGREAEQLLRLAREAIEADAALLLVAIRSDAYALMQSSPLLADIHQVPLSLGPVPGGEIARLIREPSEVLRRKAGPSASTFDAAVVERLQAEIEGEADALPLLAFVLQRLMREHAAAGKIGIKEFEQTGGVAAAIESEAEAALVDAAIVGDRAERRDVLRRLFIPRLARINRESKVPQRHIARQNELPTDLLGLAKALTQRRLLVVKLAASAEADGAADTATLEVAHEALLRRWPTLAELLAEDRDALLLLDSVLVAANDWSKAGPTQKPDFLVHRRSRLSDAQALALRGPDWANEVAPAQSYLAACRERETAEQKAEEARRLAERERERRELRRTRILALVAGIGLLGAATLALLFAQQKKDAELQRQNAERQTEIAQQKTAEAEKALNSAVTYVKKEVELATGYLENGAFSTKATRELLGSAEEALRDLEGIRASPLIKREQIRLLLTVSDAYSELGDLGNALSRAETAKSLVKQLIDEGDDGEGLQQLLYGSEFRIGDAQLDKGNWESARSEYDAALAIAERLAKETAPGPVWQVWQVNLLFIHDKEGDLFKTRGELKEAMEHYQSSLKIEDGLTAQNPEVADYWHRLSATRNRIGQILVEQGKLLEALDVYQAALDISKGLAERDPDNQARKYTLSVRYSRIGTVMQKLKRCDEASSAFGQALNIRLNLQKRDPANTLYLTLLASSYRDIGNLMIDKGALDEAIDQFELGQQILKDLADRDPGNSSWQNALSGIQKRLAAAKDLKNGGSPASAPRCQL